VPAPVWRRHSNAPLAGLVFVLEKFSATSPWGLHGNVDRKRVADITTRLFLGQLPVFHVETEPIPALSLLPFAWSSVWSQGCWGWRSIAAWCAASTCSSAYDSGRLG